jgi:mono/diheme cytochrome c family protein
MGRVENHPSDLRGPHVNLRTAFLTASVFALAVACTPAANEPAPATPDAAPIAEAAPPSGPAAENTTDSLSTTPATDPAAAPTPAAPATTPAAAPATADFTAGRAAYAATCAMCHGPTGAGTQMGVALANGLEAAVVKEKVTKGMINPGDKMPPMGAALSAEQLDSLAKFVEAGLPA